MQTNKIKKLIFDIDGTIIKWEDKYYQTIPKALEKLNFKNTEELCSNIWNAQFEYEEEIGYFDELEKYMVEISFASQERKLLFKHLKK